MTKRDLTPVLPDRPIRQRAQTNGGHENEDKLESDSISELTEISTENCVRQVNGLALRSGQVIREETKRHCVHILDKLAFQSFREKTAIGVDGETVQWAI